jgi:hypothetical protein
MRVRNTGRDALRLGPRVCARDAPIRGQHWCHARPPLRAPVCGGARPPHRCRLTRSRVRVCVCARQSATRKDGGLEYAPDALASAANIGVMMVRPSALEMVKVQNRTFGPCLGVFPRRPCLCANIGAGDGQGAAWVIAVITDMNRIHFVLFGMQNRVFSPYLG